MNSTAYIQLVKILREVKTLSHVSALLSWDQEVMMPPQGADTRAEQLALLSRIAHDKFTSPEAAAAFGALEDTSGLSHPEQACVREARRSWERETRLSSEFVEELARTQSLSQTAWITARKNSDFAAFAPWLEKLLRLKREAAQLIAPKVHPTELYDVMLDEYEPGARATELVPLFAQLEKALTPLVHAIASKPPTPRLQGEFPIEIQNRFGRKLAQAMGFSFDAGRMDVSTHPFCTSFGPRDVRITTRYDSRDFTGAIFGTLHETGHALYEQALPIEHLGTPLADAASMAIHESQSRLWENLVGRSRGFWQHFYPDFQHEIGPALQGVSLDTFYRGINRVEPTLIRTESDEVTYNLHIALRFDLERRLIAGDLSVSDLPAAWNSGMERLLGITPPDNARGVLQDVHWSMGAFGYFPTYTLGNLYSAQFLEAAHRALPELAAQISRGELQPLREWLRDQIHQYGMEFRPGELCSRVTGAPLSPQPFLNYLRTKFGAIYSL